MLSLKQRKSLLQRHTVTSLHLTFGGQYDTGCGSTVSFPTGTHPGLAFVCKSLQVAEASRPHAGGGTKEVQKNLAPVFRTSSLPAKEVRVRPQVQHLPTAKLPNRAVPRFVGSRHLRMHPVLYYTCLIIPSSLSTAPLVSHLARIVFQHCTS